MSRTFANFIYLGNLYSQNPSSDPSIIGMYNSIFRPIVKIVSEDCQTKLGDNRAVNASIRGAIELSNGDSPITPSRIQYLTQNEISTVYLRNVSSCTAENGICRMCLWGSYQYVDPLFDRETITTPGDYPSIAGVPEVGRSIRFNFTDDTTRFLSYLSTSYSGGILGMRSYMRTKLPLREGLYQYLLSEQKVAQFVRAVMDENIVGALEIEYGTKIGDNIEKVLFLLAQYFIAYYVNNLG